jgi:hypothetical protein
MTCCRIAVCVAIAATLSALAALADTGVGRDPHYLVAGDGHVTGDGAKPGYIYLCTTAPFARAPRGRQDAPWLRSDGSFDPRDKPVVDGAVRWPSRLNITVEGDQRVIVANALPSSPTGVFPIARDSAAYTFDRNPNSIREQSVRWSLPRLPTARDRPTCLPPGGPIGLFLDGSYLFNALDAAGRDGVLHEVQDACGGHPARRGDYHHHMVDLCMEVGDPAGTSPVIGIALDGFPITGPYRDGKVMTNAELDACHGRVDEIEWDGERRRLYHYVANFEYPYTLGCYRAAPLALPLTEPRPGAGPGRPPERAPTRPGR